MKNQRKRMKNPRIRTDGYAKDVVYSLDVDQIRANSAQPRRDFDVDAIVKLADSIRRYGILQPLSVRRVPKGEVAERGEKAAGMVGDHAQEDARNKKNIVADLLSATVEEVTDASGASDKAIAAPVEREDEICEKTAQTPMFPPFLTQNGEKLPRIGAKLFQNGASSPQNGTVFCNVSRETSGVQLCIDDQFPQEDEVIAMDLPTVAILEVSRGRHRFEPGGAWEYELVAGERRLRAAKMLGMRSVPCIIVDVDDAVSAELALVENMLRENLNMFEQAVAFSRLSEQYGLTQEEIAAKLSLSQSAVANKIRLLRLSEEERRLIMEYDLTERHARAFLRIADEKTREKCIHYVIAAKLNVSDTDKYIAALLANPPETPAEEAGKQESPAPTPDRICSNIYRFINKIQNVSGDRLTVNRKSDGRNVVITLTVKRDA